MKNMIKSTTIAGVAVVFLLAIYALVSTPRIESQGATQASKTPEKSESLRREYRDAVLKRMESGDVVSVPEDRIDFLEGDVKLVPKRVSAVREKTVKSLGSTPMLTARNEIEKIAGKLERPDLRDGLRKFANGATDEQRLEFLNVGAKIMVDDFNSGPGPRPTEDPTKKCYESCETVFHIVCKEVCKWDCRIVNNEKVCEQSCETICPEIRNIVCKKFCD